MAAPRLREADRAGLDGEGIAALFTSLLRDFRERRGEGEARTGRGGVAGAVA